MNLKQPIERSTAHLVIAASLVTVLMVAGWVIGA